MSTAKPLDLQRFAGGSNLNCQRCVYFQYDHCALLQKPMDPKSEACSHYQGKTQN